MGNWVTLGWELPGDLTQHTQPPPPPMPLLLFPSWCVRAHPGNSSHFHPHSRPLLICPSATRDFSKDLSLMNRSGSLKWALEISVLYLLTFRFESGEKDITQDPSWHLCLPLTPTLTHPTTLSKAFGRASYGLLPVCSVAWIWGEV